MKLIITGGAGFIGSNLILHLHEKHPEWTIYNIDKLTYASDRNYLNQLSIQSDITLRRLT